MADRSFTLLELHFHEGICLSGGDYVAGEPTSPDEERAGGPRIAPRTALAALLGLGLIVAGGLLARRTLGSDLEAAESLDELA